MYAWLAGRLAKCVSVHACVIAKVREFVYGSQYWFAIQSLSLSLSLPTFLTACICYSIIFQSHLHHHTIHAIIYDKLLSTLPAESILTHPSSHSPINNIKRTILPGWLAGWTHPFETKTLSGFEILSILLYYRMSIRAIDWVSPIAVVSIVNVNEWSNTPYRKLQFGVIDLMSWRVRWLTIFSS